MKQAFSHRLIDLLSHQLKRVYTDTGEWKLLDIAGLLRKIREWQKKDHDRKVP